MRFDSQAPAFDQRSGPPPDVAHEVALSLLALAAPVTGPTLEIGPGTGTIGVNLAALSFPYVGLDLSRPMLDVFQTKLGAADAPALLAQADADAAWPVRDASVGILFASRVAHLLSADQLIKQATRVCRQGAVFVIGRVLPDPTSIIARLRRQREAILRQAGIVPRRGGQLTRILVDRLAAAGATPLPPTTVAAWTDRVSGHDVLSRWDTVESMGGVELNVETRTGILDQLRDWARRHVDDLDRRQPITHQYTLTGVRMEKPCFTT